MRSSFAFKSNLRRYTEAEQNRKRLFRGARTGDVAVLEEAIWAGVDSDSANPLDGGKVGRCSLTLR
jgi:hypothetical protein